ncbi:MAG: extracellular solute-binding protein, partial [Clostridia bacterium]|nr:extracellular solute-binding protein [Clostridia bacterium]
MKKNILRILCLLVAIAMCLSFAGCEKKATKSSKAKGGSADIGDDTVEALDASDISNDGVAGGSDAATAKEKVSGNADDMSWSQLLSNMPKDLKGSTVTVYSWNPIKDVSGAEQVVANFQKQTGMKVNWLQGNYETYDTEILAKIKAGDSPDMIRYNYPAPARMSLCQDIKTATGSDCKG